MRMYAIFIHITLFTGQRLFSETARLTAGHETIFFLGIIFIIVLKKKSFLSNVISVHNSISMTLGYSSDVFISYFPNKVFKYFRFAPLPTCVTLLFFPHPEWSDGSDSWISVQAVKVFIALRHLCFLSIHSAVTIWSPCDLLPVLRNRWQHPKQIYTLWGRPNNTCFMLVPSHLSQRRSSRWLRMFQVVLSKFDRIRSDYYWKFRLLK
jgi:hypothetical protein